MNKNLNLKTWKESHSSNLLEGTWMPTTGTVHSNIFPDIEQLTLTQTINDTHFLETLILSIP